MTATLLTALIGEIVVVTINHESVSGTVPTVSSVSDGTANVYAKRFSATQKPEPQFGASEGIEVWWAYAANALVAATITVTMSAAIDDAVVIAAGYQGFTGTAYQTAPWDANASLPKTAQSASATPSTPTVTGLSTTSTAGMLLAGVVTCGGNGVMSPPTGYTQVQQVQNTGASNQVRGILFNKAYSSINSSITVATGSGDEGWIFWVDALTDQGSGPSAPIGKLIQANQSIKRASYW